MNSRKALVWLLIGTIMIVNGGPVGSAQVLAPVIRPSTKTLTISYTFQLPTVERVEEFDRVNIPGLPGEGEPGMPVLPFQVARILLPFGARFESVNVLGGDRVTLPGRYRVEPGQELHPAPTGTGEPTPPDPTIYGSGNPFPGALYTLLSVQKLSGYTILLLKLHPVQYIPDVGELTCYTQLTVHVEFVSTSDKPLVVPAGKARVQMLIDNPQQLDSYPDQTPGLPPHRTLSLVSPDVPCDYVLITAQTLSSAFQPLIDWKISRGLNACLYTTEAIYANYTGYDDAEKIRNFIIDAYNTWSATAHPLQYVLLGGDTEIIPVRMVQVDYGSYSTIMPVDMYYAGLDGNWDADGDKKFGEPAGAGAAGEEVDFFAEVYVGRMPVETVDEVAHMAMARCSPAGRCL